MSNEAVSNLKNFNETKPVAIFLKLEFYALLILIAFLPLTEAGKNIFIGVYLLLWFFNRTKGAASWGGVWTLWESIGLAIFLAALASYLWGAMQPDKGILSLYGTVSYVALFIAIRRSQFNEKQIQQFFVVAIASTLLTLCWGYWNLFVTHSTPYLKLNSVGHVNQGAIYIAIILAATLTWVFCARAHKKLLWATCLILWISLLITEARGAILPILMFAVPYVVYRLSPGAYSKWKILLLLGVAVAVTLTLFSGVVKKTVSKANEGNLSSYRVDIAKVATLAAVEHPFFGMGVANFHKITPALVAQWVVEYPQIGSVEIMDSYSHSHDAYFNTLAEQGIFGLVAMLAWVIFIGIHLFKRRPKVPGASWLRDLTWGSALGAWVIAVIGGFFNTTLLHEHGMITIILWALWLSWTWQEDTYISP